MRVLRHQESGDRISQVNALHDLNGKGEIWLLNNGTLSSAHFRQGFVADNQVAQLRDGNHTIFTGLMDAGSCFRGVVRSFDSETGHLKGIVMSHNGCLHGPVWHLILSEFDNALVGIVYKLVGPDSSSGKAELPRLKAITQKLT